MSRMKKYRILLSVTLPLLAALILWRIWGLPSSVAVTVHTVRCRTVEETVRCTGVVESAQQHAVYTALPCLASEVLAEEGRTVQAGDVLFTVDVDATVAAVNASGANRITAADVRRELTAPVSGVVLNVGVKAGGMTDVARPCVVIASMEQLQLSVLVRESQLRRVAVGQRVHVSGDAFAQERYGGALTHIAPMAQSTISLGGETAVEAIVTLDEGQTDASLRLGLTAKAEVVVNEWQNIPVVPYECVLQNEAGEEYVYVVRDGRAEQRIIRTVAELPEGFAVGEGLSDGDRVVRSPETVTHRSPVTVEGAA